MSPLLHVEHLGKSFGGLQAVVDVSFAVPDRSITGLIGPNGSGKTVTFDCITGFYRPDRGRVRLRDRDVTGLRPSEIARSGIARSFQITGVFPRLTVWENLCFAAQEKRIGRTVAGRVGGGTAARHVRERAEEALAFTGLGDARDQIVSSLPYGRQKLLEFGGLVLMRPEPALFLLDEPFAGLTHTEITRYIALVHALRGRGKTFLIVEHNMRVMMTFCESIVVLDHGEKIADGPPEAIQRDPRVVAAYLGQAGAARGH